MQERKQKLIIQKIICSRVESGGELAVRTLSLPVGYITVLGRWCTRRLDMAVRISWIN